MAELIWTNTALNALEDIAEYIALDNPSAAKQLVKAIFNQVERLIEFPESGHRLPELPDLPYREIIFNPCRIIYKFDTTQNQVNILGIVRQERELLRYLASLDSI